MSHKENAQHSICCVLELYTIDLTPGVWNSPFKIKFVPFFSLWQYNKMHYSFDENAKTLKRGQFL